MYKTVVSLQNLYLVVLSLLLGVPQIVLALYRFLSSSSLISLSFSPSCSCPCCCPLLPNELAPPDTLLRHKTADSIFIYYLVYYYCSVTWLRHLSYCSPFFAHFSIVLWQDPLFSIIRRPIVAAGYCSCDLLFLWLIVLVTYCSCDLLFLWRLLLALLYCSLIVYSLASE